MMTMRSSLIVVGALFAMAATAWPQAADANRPPNVVLIFADDLGYGDVGCYGATKVQTPNIDRLAREGRRFTDVHSASAVCTPSRYGLLTGRYPLRANGGKGLWGPAPITSGLLIDTERLTIADVFKNSGYDTAVIGKWHLGFKTRKNDWQEPLRPGPQDLGFDYYFGMPVVNSAPPYVYVDNERVVGGDPTELVALVGEVVMPLVRTYAEVSEGEPCALVGSSGRLEVAVSRGSAAAVLGAGLGETVRLRRASVGGGL